jgi:Tol biopolymer transport system component
MFFRLTVAFFALSAVLTGSALLIGRAHPDSVLAFVSERTGRAQVYMLDVDLQITYMVSRNDYASNAPAWSSDGDLAYVRWIPEGRDVIVYNPFTGNSCEINGRLLDEASPAWSPSGDLAYVSGQNGFYDVYTQASCAGQTARNVTRDSAHGASNPQWSSAGRLVYNDEIGNRLAVVLYNPISGESSPIRQDRALDNAPIWYEDRLVAFASYENLNSPPSFEIYVHDTETREFRNISNHPGNDTQPAWSPDGRLAFTSNRDGNNQIYVFDLDTEALTNVSRSQTNDQMPAWSSDGRLAYMSAVGSAFDIVILDRVPGGTPRVVVNHPLQDYSPVWMP